MVCEGDFFTCGQNFCKVKILSNCAVTAVDVADGMDETSC